MAERAGSHYRAWDAGVPETNFNSYYAVTSLGFILCKEIALVFQMKGHNIEFVLGLSDLPDLLEVLDASW
jgi:hypothetical protein